MIAMRRVGVLPWRPPTEPRSDVSRLAVHDLFLVGYVALLPYQIAVAGDLRMALSDFSLILYLLFNISGMRYISKAWSLWHTGLLFVFLSGIWVAANTEGNLSRYVVVNKSVGILVLFLTYAALTSFSTTWERAERVMRVFVLSVAGQNVVMIGAFLVSRAFGFNTYWLNYDSPRLSGLLIDPNAYGAMLVLALIINESTASGEAALVKGWLRYLVSLTLGFGIVCTFSRSAWIGLTVAWLASLALHRRFALRIAGGVFLATALLPFVKEDVLSFATSMASRPEQIEARMSIMQNALAEFSRSPFLGIGLGEFFLKYELIVHNTGLWFLTEFGLIGFGIFILFIGWFFAKAIYAYRMAPKRWRPLIAGLLLSHIAGLGFSVGFEAFYARSWWLVMSMIGSAYAITCGTARSAAVLPRGWARGIRS